MRRSLMDDSAAKGDGGDVSFASGAQAKNEADAPAGKFVWSGWGTIEGLKRAADSSEYSARK